MIILPLFFSGVDVGFLGHWIFLIHLFGNSSINAAISRPMLWCRLFPAMLVISSKAQQQLRSHKIQFCKNKLSSKNLHCNYLKTNWDKIFNATVESICFQDKISVILTTCLEVETYIKGHHIYKKISTPEFRKQLNVQPEPDNRVYKFVGCIKIYLKDVT